MAVNELAKRLGMNRRYVNQVVTGSVMCSDTIFFSENLEEWKEIRNFAAVLILNADDYGLGIDVADI